MDRDENRGASLLLCEGDGALFQAHVVPGKPSQIAEPAASEVASQDQSFPVSLC